MGRVLTFSRAARIRARRLRWLRDVILVFASVFILAQTDLSEQVASAAGSLNPGGESGRSAIACTPFRVIDGDTLDCAGRRIRLAGIDAPEMPGHCRPGRRCVAGDPEAARAVLQRFAAAGLSCTPSGRDTYGRTIARCAAGGRDASCALIASGHAEARYGRINCAGRG